MSYGGLHSTRHLEKSERKMKRILFVLLAFINVSSCWSQTPIWSENMFVNWFHLKRYVSYGNRLLLTHAKNVYTYDEQRSEWRRDYAFPDSSVENIVNSDTWALILPSTDLINLTTNMRINLRDMFDSLEIYSAAFDNNILAVATEREFLLINLLTMTIENRMRYFKIIDRDVNFYCYDRRISIHDGVDLYTYDFRTSKLSKKWLREALSRSYIIQRPHSSRRVPFCSENTVQIYDFITDSLIIAYKSNPFEEQIVSIYMDADTLYVASTNEASNTRIYKIDVVSGTRHEYAFVKGIGGTGMGVCDIVSVEGPDIKLTDLLGGLYGYSVIYDSLQWIGSGISEVNTRGCANYGNSIVSFFGAGADVYDHMAHERVFLPSVLLPSGEDIEMYKHYMVVNIWGNLMIRDLYDFIDQARVSGSAKDYEVIGDTAIVYSDMNGTFLFDGSKKQIADSKYCPIATDQVNVAIQSPDSTLVIHELQSGVNRSYVSSVGFDKSLIALHDNIVIFVSKDTILAYDYIASTTIWQRREDVGFIKEILWCGTRYLVTRSGKFINMLDGRDMFQVGPDITQVVVSQDTCFVFYPFRNGLKGAMCQMNEIHSHPDQSKLQQNIRVSETALRGEYDIIVNAVEHGYLEIAVYNILGTRVQSLFEGRSTTGEFHIPLNMTYRPSGVYFVMLRSGAGINMTKMLHIK
jgi:hypothetical protein